MPLTIKSAVLVLALVASTFAEDVEPSFPGNAVPPAVTPAPKGPQPGAAQVAGPLTIHVTNSFGAFPEFSGNEYEG